MTLSPPSLPIGAEWPRAGAELPALRIAASTGWRHDGVRMELRGDGGGLRAAGAGFPLVDEMELGDRSGDVTVGAASVEWGAGGERSRVATALELPLLYLECEGGSAAWRTQLAEPAVDAAPDGTRLLLRSTTTGERALFAVRSGRLAYERDGSGLHLTWRGDRRLVLVAIAAQDEADLGRSIDLLARRELNGLGRQRNQHAEQLHRGGVAVELPEPADARALVEWAKVHADARLGAWIARGGYSGNRDAAESLARGLLAAGLSERPRALLRMGSGKAESFSRLRERYRAWVGESPDQGHGESPALPAEEHLETGPWQAPSLAEVAAGRASDRDIGSVLTELIEGAWGVSPDAPHGAVAVAPILPGEWSRLALSRLRVGRSVLDVRLRRRGETVGFAVRRGAGPRIAVRCTVRGVPVREMLLDGEPIGGTEARFDAEAEHHILLHTGP